MLSNCFIIQESKIAAANSNSVGRQLGDLCRRKIATDVRAVYTRRKIGTEIKRAEEKPPHCKPAVCCLPLLVR